MSCVYGFVGFLDHVLRYALMRLGLVPRAPVRLPQAPDGTDKLLELRLRFRRAFSFVGQCIHTAAEHIQPVRLIGTDIICFFAGGSVSSTGATISIFAHESAFLPASVVIIRRLWFLSACINHDIA